MLGHEKGTCSGSDLYFSTPSERARRMLYYMTSCGYYFTNYDYRIERDDYQNFLLFYLADGRLSVTSGGRTLVAEAGQIGFLDCHAPHEYHTIGHTEFWWLHMDGAGTRQFYEEITDQAGGFVFSAGCAPALQQMIYEVVSSCRTDQLPHEAQTSLLLYRMLTTLLGCGNQPGTDTPQHCSVDAAVRFIRSQFSQKLSLEDVARHVNMSQFHFARMFKKSCGYSPHEFLILTRINHAKHLLKTTTLPVKVIAQRAGYQNVTTFTNAFSSRVGLSPSQFRKYPV